MDQPSEKIYCKTCKYCMRTKREPGSLEAECAAPDNMVEAGGWYSPISLRFSESPAEKNHQNSCTSYVPFALPPILAQES